MSRVLLFAALRDLAGSAELQVDAPDVGALTKELAARYGEEFERILAAGSVVVGDQRAGPSHPLAPEDEVALLPPVSGGAGIRGTGRRFCAPLQSSSNKEAEAP